MLIFFLFTLLHLEGEKITPYLEAISSLAHKVFYEYPYLYCGENQGYDESLRGYATIEDSIVILALDGEQVVGMASGIPLKAAWEKYVTPLKENGTDIESSFYLGELIVLPNYRGKGLGYKMGKEIESFAKKHNYSQLTFLSIDEALLKVEPPKGYISSACTFRKLGYTKYTTLFTDIDWTNVNEVERTPHRLIYWMCRLD